MTMFKCQACGSTEFNLVINPNYKGQVSISTNEYGDVVVQAGAQKFVADLMFMNQYGSCARCEATKQWVYHYPNAVQEANAS